MIHIDWNDPFYGLMLGLGIIALIATYLAFFAKVKEEPKEKRRFHHS